MIAIGNSNAVIKVYIENRPPLAPYQTLEYCLPLTENDIANIANETGNHWRKIFNVYAKLIFELSPNGFGTWQQFREGLLLQKQSDQCLVFSAPELIYPATELSIIMGKSYATKLGLAQKCHWVTPYFAINQDLKLIICPYFDYRQLSNEKIIQLVALIKQVK